MKALQIESLERLFLLCFTSVMCKATWVKLYNIVAMGRTDSALLLTASWSRREGLNGNVNETTSRFGHRDPSGDHVLRCPRRQVRIDLR